MNTNQIIQIAEDALGIKVKRTEEPQHQGYENIVHILVADEGKFVFRTNPDEKDTLRYQKEKWCMETASKAGIPVPDILKIGSADGHPYMLMSFIGGTHGANSPKIDLIWSKIGEYAHKIHDIKPLGYGGDMNSPGSFGDGWLRYVDYNMQSLTHDDKLLKLGYISSEESTLLKDVFAELKNTRFQFGLTHYDLAPKNTIITDEHEVYLIDWGSAGVFIVPHADIAEIKDEFAADDSPEFRSFLEGYGLKYPDYEKIREQLRKIDLLTSTDNLRHGIDHKPEKLDYFADFLRKKIKEYRNQIT